MEETLTSELDSVSALSLKLLLGTLVQRAGADVVRVQYKCAFWIYLNRSYFTFNPKHRDYAITFVFPPMVF